MKHILTILALVSSSAYAYCPYDQNYNNCVQMEQMQQQINQQQELQHRQAHEAQQPRGWGQQCFRNIYGVVECR